MTLTNLALKSLRRRHARGATLLSLLIILTVSIVSMTGVRAMLGGADAMPASPTLDIDAGAPEQSAVGTQQTDSINTLIGSTTATLTMLFGIIAITAVISLILVEIFWTRGRRNECGIYLALGKPKTWIASLFTLETGILAACATCISLPLAAGISAAAKAYLSNSLGIIPGTFWTGATFLSAASVLLVFFALATGLAPILTRTPRSILASLD